MTPCFMQASTGRMCGCKAARAFVPTNNFAVCYTHPPLAQLPCVRHVAGASQLRLCLTAALCGFSVQMAAKGRIEPWF